MRIGGGRGESPEDSPSEPLPQSQRGDGERTSRSRYRGRRPAPVDSYPEAAQTQELLSRLERFSSHHSTACSWDSVSLVLVSLKVTKRPALPAHPNSESPLSLAQNCQGQQRLFGTKLTHGRGARTWGCPETLGKQSANCGRCPGEFSSISDLEREPTLTKHPPAHSTLLPMVLCSGNSFTESAHSGIYGARFARSSPPVRLDATAAHDLQAGGRWFEPSTAHLTVEPKAKGPESLPGLTDW
jgi:hypothetical protein